MVRGQIGSRLTRPAIGLAVSLISAGLLGTGLLVHGLSVHSSPRRPSLAPSLSSTVEPPPSPALGDAPPPAHDEPGTGASTGVDVGAGNLADILEAEGGQLTDLLAHFKISCTAVKQRQQQPMAVDVVSRCVEDAEGVMSLVDLIQGSIEGPASASMPGDVRNRWEDTLSSARATIREVLTPVWDVVGRDLTSRRSSPATFRALAHLRDRISRVLSTAERP
jgi:hypothetical protein